jgi:hypothetical protein
MKEHFPLIKEITLGFIPGAVFAGIAAAVLVWVLIPPLSARRVLNNGVDTTARVVNFAKKFTETTSSGSSSSKTEYFYIKLSFVNPKGKEVVYKTRSIYTRQFISRNNITGNETVQVICKGNKAVVKGYEPKETVFGLWVFVLIFSAIGVLLWALVAWSITNVVIMHYGTYGTGIYQKTEKSSFWTEPYIIFSFENKNGEQVEFKTGYISIDYKVEGLNDYEVEALIEMKSFPIKFRGNKAVIMMEKTDFPDFPPSEGAGGGNNRKN